MRNHPLSATSSFPEAHIKSFQMTNCFIKKLIICHNITKEHTNQIDSYVSLTEFGSEQTFIYTNFLMLVVTSTAVNIVGASL